MYFNIYFINVCMRIQSVLVYILCTSAAVHVHVHVCVCLLVVV